MKYRILLPCVYKNSHTGFEQRLFLIVSDNYINSEKGQGVTFLWNIIAGSHHLSLRNFQSKGLQSTPGYLISS